MYNDLSGYAVSVTRDEVREAWNETVEAILSHDASAADRIARILVLDPDFALAHAVNGLMLLSLARADLVPAAVVCMDEAWRAQSNRGINTREGLFLQALEQWILDAPRKSATILERVLTEYPCDMLAIKLAHMLRFALGDQAQMLAILQRVVPAFGRHHPYSGYAQGCLAFALEERHLYTEAEHAGRLAVDLAPRDVWGRHAVAHVLEMTGRADEGMAWLSDRGKWSHANNFSLHLTWHHALFKLEAGQFAEATALYDESMAGNCSDDYRDIASCASLLARLEYEGIDVGSRWDAIADRAERRAFDGRLVFADVHYVLALLGAGRVKSADELARRVVDDSFANSSDERRVAARCGGTVACGLLSFQDGDYIAAAKWLSAARSTMTDIGGSNAQRDLFEQVYIESLLRSGDEEQAATLLTHRLAARMGKNRFAVSRLNRLQQTSVRLGALATLTAASTKSTLH
ncbi:tetratricopeptide repeat protein [Bradyrhizobium sp. 180]|uniref:tetratricopeptide repeat protein n=1 Tax=Bradyrhizobium sp. 180 TaxID=2782650 RepID=UPI001FFAC758|nr:tetratricopeptide repeat protein [Bradyrhizobium sp. 180]MCK1492135.1 tetratricopeptide repeat protein [Bradyrhizobium sp. 180]